MINKLSTFLLHFHDTLQTKQLDERQISSTTNYDTMQNIIKSHKVKTLSKIPSSEYASQPLLQFISSSLHKM